jgi:DNA mismatch endonuclease (patch repair protein)
MKSDKNKRSYIMSRIKSKNTKPEKYVENFLKKRKVRYNKQCKLPGKPDFFIKKLNRAIFVNGCFWHMHKCYKFKMPKSNVVFWKNKLKTNKKRDIKNCNKLRNMGIKVLNVWECNLERIRLYAR